MTLIGSSIGRSVGDLAPLRDRTHEMREVQHLVSVVRKKKGGEGKINHTFPSTSNSTLVRICPGLHNIAGPYRSTDYNYTGLMYKL